MARYKKNFLTNVLYRLDFSDIEELNDVVKLESIYESFKDEFTVKNIGKTVENSISIDPVTNQSSVVQNALNQLVCNSSNNSKRITINKRFLILELNRYSYTNFLDFLCFIEKVHREMNDFQDSLKIKRMGVRYVNQIVKEDGGSPFANSDLINENLTKKEIKFFSDELQNKMNRSLSQTFFTLDDYQVTFTNGYINSQFPAKILRNEYLLDIDCFTMSCKFGNVTDIVKKMVGETIYPLFEASINDGLRNIMNQ